MRTIMEFITQSAVKIYYEFLHLRSFICLGMQKNMDIAEWNNKIGYILSFLSPLSRRVRTNAAKMHHAVQAWCKVSMSGRFARSAPSVGSAGGAFCRFPVPLCICPPLPLSRCVGTNSVKMARVLCRRKNRRCISDRKDMEHTRNRGEARSHEQENRYTKDPS